MRQVEAAIAPLRSSTESPERSSSPESDTMLIADREIMTLPLRKRKLYMNEESGMLPLENVGGNGVTEHKMGSGGDNATSSAGSAESSAKVMRMSSVIQFAKAS